MHVNLELLRWQRKRMGNPTYEELAELTGLSSTTLCDMFRGVLDPRASTIQTVFHGLGLNPKYAFDFELKEKQFRRAVVVTAR